MSRSLEQVAATSVVTSDQITQATAVEQARAVAEVQAAIIVAQQNPRNEDWAVEQMRRSCSRLALASRAFYTVPNRGSGPSITLATELARIWQNVDYGVHELRRDDLAHMSEIRAFAWDQQTNVRTTRTFQVPHARMKKVNGKQTREPLYDLTDVYLNNQNIGARAVRECIFKILPTWFTEEAQDLCRQTLENGEGEPLADRINKMISAFEGIGVTVDQLEQQISRPRSKWNATDVAEFGIVYKSIQRREVTVDEAFPAKRVTTEEIAGATGNEYDPTGEDGWTQ